MIKDKPDSRDYITLLSLISENSGRFDICALIYDICTGNKNTYIDEKTGLSVYEPIDKRILDIKNISEHAFIDLKRIIKYIKFNFISKNINEKSNDNILVVFSDTDIEAEYVSIKFDDVFIKNIIEKYYHDELN